MRRLRVLAFLFSMSVLVASPVSAASITISDLGSSVQIAWAGFDLGFSVAGVSYAQPTFSVTVPDAINPATLSPALISFAGHWTSPMPGFTYVHKVMYFQDAASNLTDLLQVDYGNYSAGAAVISGVFSSAMAGSPWTAGVLNSLGPPVTSTILEGPGIELVPSHLGSSSTLSSFVVNAGGGAASAVPEPATLLLLATGLAAVAARRRFATRP